MSPLIVLAADTAGLLRQAEVLRKAFQKALSTGTVSSSLPLGPTAVFVGANLDPQDEPASQYELFVYLMESIFQIPPAKCSECKKSGSVQGSTVILLSGGNPQRGWEFVQGLRSSLLECVCVIGISAGAMQLGRPMLCIVPWFVVVHEEAEGWPSEKALREAHQTISKDDILCLSSGTIRIV